MSDPVRTSENGPALTTGQPAKDSGGGMICVEVWIGDPFPALQWLQRGDWLVLQRRKAAGYQSAAITASDDA